MSTLGPLGSAMPKRELPGSGKAGRHDQAEANLSALIESTEDLIWSVDLEYRLIAFNRALRENIKETFGVRLEPGMRLHELLPPDRSALWPPFFEHVLHQGPFRVEYALIRHRILELAFNPIVVDGETTGISVFGKDITERKAAESALKEAETRYRAIFDGAMEGMFQASVDGKPLTANLALAKMLGYDSPNEILSTVSDLAQDQWADPNDRKDYLRRLEERGAVRGFECRLRRKDKTIIWAALNARKVSGADGRMLYLEGFIEDITERKQAEIRLRESEESLRESQRIAGIGSYVLDIRTGVWSSSEVLDEIFGIGPAYERTVEGWTALIHPDDRVMMAAYLSEEVVGKGKAFDKEYRIVRQTDGEERWVHGLGRLDFNAQGQPVRMRGTIREITESKQAEMRLRESEERYRATFEQAVVGIVHASFEGVVLHCNAHFAEMLGYTAGELPGHTIRQLTAPEDLAATAEALGRMRSGAAASESMEKRHLRKDGSLTWTRMTVSIQRDGEGRPLHFVAIAEDINTRKAAQERLAAASEALSESEERYRATFEQAAVGIVHTSFEGRILRCNRHFAEILGYAAEEVPGMTVWQITLPEDHAGSRRTFEETSSGAVATVVVEKRYIRKDGSPIWVKLTISTQRDTEGRPVHSIAVVEDINDRKAAEERLAAAAEALRLSEERYRIAFETSLDAVYIGRACDGMFVDCNKACLEFLGYRREEMIGKTTLELNIWADPRDRQRLAETLRQNSICRDLEARFRKKNGEVSLGLMSASVIELDGVPCFLTMTRDISEARAAAERLAASQEALRVSEERYRTAFQTSLDGININRLSDGMYIECNKAFLDMTGYDREEVIGRTSLELKMWADPRNRHRLVEMLRQNSTCRDLEVQFRKKNGEVFWVMVSASLIELDGVPCILSVVRDISQAKAAEDRIKSLALYDPLTGLPNRRLLLERLRETLAASPPGARRHAVLLVNLDNFKMLNETIGHQTGDLLLQETARRLVSCLGDAGSVARLGGDEFVVTLDNLSPSAEEAAAQVKSTGRNILSVLSQPYLLAGRSCSSTASIGITVVGDGPQSAEEILQEADIALDRARTAGRNTIHFFAPALQAAVNARAALEDDLRLAIKTNEFVLYYQPQVSGGRLIGAEALIRWNHPRRGLLLPGEFIPLAEETELILPMGDWVLETACKLIAALAYRGASDHVVIAVNISARQFRQPDFVQRVLDALDRTGASPRNLDLELTESMLAENIEEVIAKMTYLKSHGLRFSLDDFGTGYSSLAYLKRLPLDVLKIDRSFVRDILVDAGSGAIAQTILSLSRAMGLPVIAEGVENEEQREFLAGLGCHSFQGYLFSHPLPLAELERVWLNAAESSAPILQ
jgi:diguanylate cyclase (GGDEF)-like protein/PAS domain S-box-containing protein